MPVEIELPEGVADTLTRVRQCICRTPTDIAWDAMLRNTARLHDLTDFIANSDPKIVRRIVRTLLAPDVHRLPFSVGQDRPRNCLPNTTWIEGLNESQAILTARYVRKGIGMVERKRDSDSIDAHGHYLAIILQLLPELPQAEAEKLWRKFRILDLATWWSADEASGYNPLEALYYSSVDESWKRRGAEELHRVIRRELSDEARSRRDWEGALVWDRMIIERMLVSEKPPVSKAFIVEEVVFLLDQRPNEPAVNVWGTERVMDMITDTELRHRFVRQQVLKADVFVYSEEQADTARKIMAEFSNDGELTSRLLAQLEAFIKN